MFLKKFRTKGFSVKIINWIFIIFVLIACTHLFFNTFDIWHEYNFFVSETFDYTECDKAVNDFRDAEQYLSNQMQLFAINHKPEFLDNYYKEYNTVKRRQSALEILQLTHVGDDADIKLRMALRESEYLREVEIYSQKLIIEGLNDPAKFQKYNYVDIVLTDEDKALSSQQKIKKGIDLLFDNYYISTQERILKNSSASLNAIIYNSLSSQKKHNAIIEKRFFYISLNIILLLIASAIYYFIIIRLILRPLTKHIKSIEKGNKIEVIGSREFRFIAKTYNSLIEKNEIKASALRHKAEHDFLTGLINREAFEQIKNIYKEASEEVAYLLIDIDYFKKINDTYGHPIGDEVLKKIGHLLSDQFRDTDYVARIGGDEFAVIMTKFGESPVSVIHRKISSINTILQNIQDGLPSVSLSVGVSFSECGFIDELEKQADEALYRVKKGGRCNCSFYKNDYIYEKEQKNKKDKLL